MSLLASIVAAVAPAADPHQPTLRDDLAGTGGVGVVLEERRPTSGVAMSTAMSTAPVAAPCPTCTNPIMWVDAYGNLHCGNCEPPIVAAMARTWLVVAHEPDGRTTWEPITPGARWLEGATP